MSKLSKRLNTIMKNELKVNPKLDGFKIRTGYPCIEREDGKFLSFQEIWVCKKEIEEEASQTDAYNVGAGWVPSQNYLRELTLDTGIEIINACVNTPIVYSPKDCQCYVCTGAYKSGTIL